jgi:hypothetical protein
MARWLIELNGNPTDLTELSPWLPLGEVYLLHDGNATYLAGERLEVETDVHDVYDLAVAYCAEISAAAELMLISGEPVTPGLVHRENNDGTRTTRGFGGAGITINVRVKRAAPTGPGETILQVLISESRRSQHFHAAIDAWAMKPRTWPRLYRALEEVEEYLGSSAATAGLCSTGDRDRLKHSANSAEIAGLDARHRLRKFQVPTKPMSLQEASIFIRGIIEAAAVKVSARRSAA